MNRPNDRPTVWRGPGLGGAAAVAAAVLSAGCVSVESVAPPVSGLRGGGREGVAEGRRLYLTTCTKCHAAEPVRDYSRAEWSTILPDMVEESHFSPAQTAAVAAYVRAVLSTPPVDGAGAR